MFSNIQQIVFIIILTLIPLYLFKKKKDDLLVIWILVTASFEILSAMKFINLTAFKICGFVLLPYFINNIKSFYKSSLGKILIVISIYLFLISALFSFIFPWQDTTGARAFMDLSFARSIKQLGTYLSEISIAFYLSQKIIELDFHKKIFYIIFYSSLVMCASLYFEFFLKFDFYNIVTEGTALLLDYRMRGFSHEPRGAAQIIVYGILVLLTMDYFKSFFKKVIFLLFLFSGLYLCKSMTSIVMLLFGLATLFLCNIFISSRRRLFFKSFFLPLGTALLFLWMGSFILESKMKQDFFYFKQHLKGRSYIVEASSIDEKLEISEQCAYTFLKNNPRYILTGVGQGQSGLACTPYLLDKWKRVFPKGMDMCPLMGFFYQLMQGGLVVIFLWVLFLAKGCSILYRKEKELFILSLLFILMYFIQMRFYFPITLGLLLSYSYPSRKIQNNIESQYLASSQNLK